MSESCEWKQLEDMEVMWYPSCDQRVRFVESKTPRWHTCPYCSKPLVIKKAQLSINIKRLEREIKELLKRIEYNKEKS